MIRKIFYGAAPQFIDSDRRNIDRGNYRCKALRQDKKGRPAVISQSMDKGLPVWKVEFGFSCVFFGSYEEALAYCKGKFPDNGRRAV